MTFLETGEDRQLSSKVQKLKAGHLVGIEAVFFFQDKSNITHSSDQGGLFISDEDSIIYTQLHHGEMSRLVIFRAVPFKMICRWGSEVLFTPHPTQHFISDGPLF